MMNRYGRACLVSALLFAAPALAQQSGSFVTRQTNNEWRASKLAGVDVYSSDNQKIGTIDDILMNSSGKAATVVISSGGVLGVGGKDIAVPFDKVNWSTQGRTIAVGNNPSAGSQGDTAAAQNTAAQGYPDRAMLDMSKSAFDSAPTFTYAQAATSNSGSSNSSTGTSRPKQ